MTPAEKHALKARARALLSAPVPDSVRLGSALQAAQYRDDAAVIATYVLRGINAEKALFALLRMEGLQPVAVPAGVRSVSAGARPAVHTPPSNTGVNDASGNGRGLERGYLAAAARVQMSFATARGLA